MFVIFGIRRVKKPVENGLRLRRSCDRCHFLSELQEHSLRSYFTIIFIPLVPLGKGESLLICSRCEAAFYPQAEDYLAAGEGAAVAERAIITCAYCDGRLRVPAMRGKKLLVTCPHCKEKFSLELNEKL